MIERHIWPQRERHAEELRRDEESRLDHLVQLEERLDLTLVEVEFGDAALLLKIAPVPRLHGIVASTRRRERLQFVLLACRPRLGRFPDRVQEFSRARRRLGHGIGEPIGGVVLESKNPGLLGAKGDRLGGDRTIVGGAACLATLRPSPKGAFT